MIVSVNIARSPGSMLLIMGFHTAKTQSGHFHAIANRRIAKRPAPSTPACRTLVGQRSNRPNGPRVLSVAGQDDSTAITGFRLGSHGTAASARTLPHGDIVFCAAGSRVAECLPIDAILANDLALALRLEM